MDTGSPSFVSAADAAELGTRLLGVEVSARALYGDRDLNFELRACTPESTSVGRWVLKLTADDASRASERIGFQAAALRHLESVRMRTEVPRVVVPRAEELPGPVIDGGGIRRRPWILTWVEGQLLDEFEHYDDALLESLGAAVAEVDRGLMGFEDARAECDSRWDSLSALDGRASLEKIEDATDRRLATEMFELFARALPRLAARPWSVIHNDGGNQHNMLVGCDAQGRPRVRGVIDFGDARRTARLCGLGIAAAYATFGVEDPVRAICAVSRGYAGLLPTQGEDTELLLPAVLARLLTTVTVAAERRGADPDDTYAQVSVDGAWRSLRALRELGSESVTARIQAALGERT